ncbi:MAG: DUF262 domain-containing protein [Bacilli bacterium]|nr:DUF262 domain-containing protein [Bacilli bacterium]
MAIKTVDSKAYPLKVIFQDKYDVDFYQREYVWQTKQIEDLISDLSNEFLKNYKVGDPLKVVNSYDPYFMGEIVLSVPEDAEKRKAIIDGQQRITTLTLLLIYVYRTFGKLEKFPNDIKDLIYSDYYGDEMFNLEIEERKECMLSLLKAGEYIAKENDSVSVKNLVDRYNDIHDCWNEAIDESNAVHFCYWLKEKIIFSKVWTNSDEFAYVIFETMNDRGLSLTQVEMLRSYLLANIDDSGKRKKAMADFDDLIKRLMSIKLSSKSKAEFEFFKLYFRGHYAEDLSQGKNAHSDFVRIGKEFHRWFSDNDNKLGLSSSDDYVGFIKKLVYFGNVYEKISSIIQKRDTANYLYLIVNSDYNFTLQYALLISAIKFEDSDDVVEEKIKIVSKYITKVLTWKTWNHEMISQSAMEAPVYQLCKDIRDLDAAKLREVLNNDPLKHPDLDNAPVLNQQIKHRLLVMLSLITEIVGRESNESDYLLNKPDMEVEHIWSNHYDQHTDEFDNETDFATARNTIGDLLVLPKSFNASYNDDPYENKMEQYFSQNILAQTLNKKKYENAPGFAKFMERSKIAFKSYDSFKKDAIAERTELYKSILKWDLESL